MRTSVVQKWRDVVEPVQGRIMARGKFACSCLLLATVGLFGSSTIAVAQDGLRFASGSGMVVMSLTVPPGPVDRHPAISLLYRRVYSATTDTVPVNHGYFLDPYDPILAQGRKLGRLAALTLAAGNYEFYGYRIPVVPAVAGYPYENRTKTTPIRFSVLPGQITYAGNLVLAGELSDDEAWHVADQRERDIPIFLAKHPGTKRGEIHYQLMK